MAVKSKIGISGQKLFQSSPPKRTRQGQGKNSKRKGPRSRKLLRGQGK